MLACEVSIDETLLRSIHPYVHRSLIRPKLASCGKCSAEQSIDVVISECLLRALPQRIAYTTLDAT